MNKREQMILTIVNMWKQNKSGSEIAKVVNLSRSAVMGHIYRLKMRGLVDSKKSTSNVSLQPKPVKIKTPMIKPQKNTKRGRPRKPPAPPAKAITLLQLRENSCRYIFDLPDQSNVFFCGQPKERGSYCAYHAELCYVKTYKEQRSDGNNYSIKPNPSFINTKG